MGNDHTSPFVLCAAAFLTLFAFYMTMVFLPRVAENAERNVLAKVRGEMIEHASALQEEVAVRQDLSAEVAKLRGDLTDHLTRDSQSQSM